MKIIFFLESPHPDLRRSFSNSPLINKHIRSSLQVPSSPVHSTSSMDSIDSSENNPTGLIQFHYTYLFTKYFIFSSDDVQGNDNQFDPFSSTAKEMKTDFYRRLINKNLCLFKFLTQFIF
jgi:hypothetical protein